MQALLLFFLLLCHGGEGGVSAMYDREMPQRRDGVNALKKKPVIRFIKSCGPKILRNPYRVITIQETQNSTNYLPLPGDYNYYFYYYYFQFCNFDFLCSEEFFRASKNGNDELVLHFLQNGTSFWFEAYDLSPYTWHVADLLEVFQKYNITTTKGYKFIHENDETRDYASQSLLDFYGIWEKSYRNYWWDIPEYRHLHSTGQLDWLPSRFLHSPEIPFHQQKLSSHRLYNITFIGNTNTNAKRASHIQEFQLKMNVTVEGLVTSTGGQHGVNFLGGTKYLDTMLESRFCLQLRGRSTECHRLYESFECGCLPVLIDSWNIFNYSLSNQMNIQILVETFPWKNTSGSQTPTLPFMIWVRDVEEFKELYHHYVDTSQGLEQLDRLQAQLMVWWDQTKRSIQKYYTKEFCIA
jgi:hypothetical protein